MMRILRAFVWLRWRILINTFETTGARDTVERFSLAIEKLGPIMAVVLLVPSGLALAVLGAAGGYALASGNEHSLLFEATRFILVPVTVLSVIGPLFLPAADRTNPVRLLLLPIPRGTMYLAQSASAFSDPWVLLMLPLALCLPLGMAAGGALGPALVTLVAAVVLIVAIVGLSSVATSLLHLAVRDRRRGELLILLFIVVIPAVSMLPGLLGGTRHRPRGDGGPGTRERALPAWVSAAGERAFALAPTELYVATTRAAAGADARSTGGPLLALAVEAILLHAFGVFAFGLVLHSPGSTGTRRAVPMRAAWRRRLPGLSPRASAVALAHLRLVIRTPRGRATVLSPLMMFVVFAVVMQRKAGMSVSPMGLESGLGLASFASFMCLLSILPIAMNQFAVDGAGLTLVLLSPIEDREYLAGKAVGNALITGPSIVICVLGSIAVFPGGSLAMWLALPLALAAVSIGTAPAAAIASAIFPRVVNMNSIGRGSNAHGLAGLIGLLAFAVSAVPCVLITFAASRLLHRPFLAPALLLVWCVVAYGISRLLFIPARKIFASRRENLAMLRR